MDRNFHLCVRLAITVIGLLAFAGCDQSTSPKADIPPAESPTNTSSDLPAHEFEELTVSSKPYVRDVSSPSSTVDYGDGMVGAGREKSLSIKNGNDNISFLAAPENLINQLDPEVIYTFRVIRVASEVCLLTSVHQQEDLIYQIAPDELALRFDYVNNR